MFPKNIENIYWLFTASAQSIAAFFAFLLAGYTIVLNIMDNKEDKDDSLEEVHHLLKSNYHSQLTGLALLTALAIIISLSIVYINGFDYKYKYLLILIGAVFDVVAILWGTFFIINIIDPNKYSKAAVEIGKKKLIESKQKENNINSNKFFTKFIRLESIIRDFLISRQLYDIYKGKMKYSFRLMVEELYRNDIIDIQLRNDLLELNKIRNMLFHGHIDYVDKKFLITIDDLSTRLSISFIKINPKWLEPENLTIDGTLDRIWENDIKKALNKAIRSSNKSDE